MYGIVLVSVDVISMAINRGPTRFNNNNLLIFKLAQHVSVNSLPIFRSARLWITACGIMPCKNGYILVAKATSRSLPSVYPSLQGIIPHAVIHSLALQKMGKDLPETFWAKLKISKLLLLYLVGPLLYVDDVRSNTHQIHDNVCYNPSKIQNMKRKIYRLKHLRANTHNSRQDSYVVCRIFSC